MKPIFIIGAGGLGKEVYNLIDDINSISPTYDIKGFLDKDISKKQVKIGNRIIEVFKEDFFLEKKFKHQNVHLAIAIGSPNAISKVCKFYKGISEFIFPNLIHPTVQYRNDAIDMKEGNIISANSQISVDVEFGSFNFINLTCTIGHDTKIGSFNVINPGVNLSGGVIVGNNNLIGTNSTILQYLQIGNNNTITAASFLSKDVENNLILVGNPARVMGLNN
jgi:sugar O-acyltransferase (sialic acid O-acetyltransferase NeuD family)